MESQKELKMESQEDREIEVDITRDDYVACMRYITKHKKLTRPYQLVNFALLCGFVILINLKRLSDVKYMLVQFLILSIVYLFLTFLLLPLLLSLSKYTPLKKGATLGKHLFKITSEGFRELTDTHDLLSKWDGIQSIEEPPKYIYVFIDRHMAHIIPKRCLQLEDGSREIYTYLQKRLHHARQISSSIEVKGSERG